MSSDQDDMFSPGISDLLNAEKEDEKQVKVKPDAD